MEKGGGWFKCLTLFILLQTCKECPYNWTLISRPWGGVRSAYSRWMPDGEVAQDEKSLRVMCSLTPHNYGHAYHSGTGSPTTPTCTDIQENNTVMV